MQYKGDSGIDTKGDTKSGIKYTYDKVINFVSNSPYSFRGCFVCGNKKTTASPTTRKKHGPEMIMRKSINLFWAYGLINYGQWRIRQYGT